MKRRSLLALIGLAPLAALIFQKKGCTMGVDEGIGESTTVVHVFNDHSPQYSLWSGDTMNYEPTVLTYEKVQELIQLAIERHRNHESYRD